ncbi:Attractin-like protein 1 [Nymphon striatum]|nr:Attractin-like protein 1 [Nymphon striatum]
MAEVKNSISKTLCDSCNNVECINGICIDGHCVCEKGWQGPACQFCAGRVLLTNQSGYITDGPGNYSVDIQCTWLIDAGRHNVSIRLALQEFSTECNWDHLYIHDGDSVFAPLVAVYSGISEVQKYKDSFSGVITNSGYAFLHFYSDAAFNMTGFNISYSVGGCPQNCSNHGFCLDGVCTCWGNWKGDSCDIPECSTSNCKFGLCNENGHGCICQSGYTGLSCDISIDEGYWDVVPKNGWVPEGRASHQVVVDGNIMWVVGGEYLNYSNFENIVRYNLDYSEWSTLNTFGDSTPPQRYGHSLVLHDDSMYMYGGLRDDGVILNDLWKLEKQGNWVRISVLVNPSECDQGRNCMSLAAVGHTATAVGDKMIVIFGHNPKYGYLNSVQEYHFKSREWLIVKSNGAIVKGGYGHSSVFDPKSKLIYVHGGYQSDTPTAYTLVDSLYSYNPDTYTWNLLTPSYQPRYFHSAVMLNSVMLVFGGNTHNGSSSLAQCFSADFVAYDPVCDTWKKLVNPNAHMVSDYENLENFVRTGHTAIVYKSSMYIYGGFSGQMSRNLLKYTPGTGPRQTSYTTFAQNELADLQDHYETLPTKKGCEVSCLRDELTELIVAANRSSRDTSTLTFQMWPGFFLNHRAQNSRYMKNILALLKLAMVIPVSIAEAEREFSMVNRVKSDFRSCMASKTLSNLMIMKLFISSFQALDPDQAIKLWYAHGRRHMSQKHGPHETKEDDRSCSIYTTSKSCVEALPGIKCVWSKIQQRCQPYENSIDDEFLKCPKIKSNNDFCGGLNICPSCLHNSYGCVWCGTYCAHQKCNKNIQTVTSVEECSPAVSSRCDKLHNCFACHTEKYCGWHNDNKCYIFVREIGNKTEKAALTDEHRLKCDVPCSARKTCQNCTQGQCLWCNNQQRCIDNNAYIVSFPYGQCRDWTNHSPKCPAATCSEIRTCDSCQSNPECGWCDDGNDTGLGKCMEGSSLGPVKKDGLQFKLVKDMCLPPKWFFSECPSCQCNGHSKCDSNDICIQPCSDLTEGPQCENCLGGYFGNPINGGKCNPCECNNHADLCHRSTGKCYCTTKGISGHRCDRCDESSKYFGNPKDDGSCFYNLTIDYQFTFNMSKPDDAHLTQINFQNTPLMNDVDVEFSIKCSSKARVNITLMTDSVKEKSIVDAENCKDFKIRIPHNDLNGYSDNVTFYVFVYGFKTPMSVKVSFSQHKTLDLLQFFVTFSSCFLSLLVIAGILWKFKQKYEAYRRRQVSAHAIAFEPCADHQAGCFIIVSEITFQIQ